ncbi:YkyA family protein [Bacillus sp. FJAT-27251]|uniref:YkyA family protein n=1 Tax=Bacillus sp. FJAT-27251 TaxID=1684142 RepID=UPI000840A95F|nr:YkyA family protein [Bacillus sp. FJAT-27251]
MANYRKILVFVLLISLTAFAAGCMNRQDPAEQIFTKLEEVVQIEKAFEEQQEPLVKLEQEEKELYAKIIELNMEQHDEIVRLADEAITIADKRKEHLDKEKESIEESREEFGGVEGIADKLEDSELEKQVADLQQLMLDRYAIHDELYKSYTDGLSYDKALYELLKDKDLTIETLEEQINKVNAAYDEVLSANERFNEKTDQYNKAKLSFYDAAGLNVETE